MLFGVGFLLLIVGSLLLAAALRRAGLVGAAWAFPMISAAGGVLAIAAVADPYHDVGLFVFFSAWVALGLAMAGHITQSHRGAAR